MALSVCQVLTDLHDRELTEHGDAAFPIACYEDNLSINSVPWHWHEEWEFAVVCEGSPELLLENQRITLKTGDAFFINGKALHAANTGLVEPSIIHSAVFHPRLIGGNTDSVFWQSLVQPFITNSSTRYILFHPEHDYEKSIIDHFVRAWEAIAKDKDDYANVVRYELSALMREIILHNDFTSSNFSEQELVNARRIRTMLEYIEEHYNEDITVDDLAATITASSSACLRCFHQMLHTTPMQYVKQLRIKKSADLLLTSKKSAKEIALMCGFNDISYFTRAFKETYGLTPKEYRRR